ncbi:MAG: TonB-dependent receptor [Sphingobacteriales bacterium]|nr:MAG: TonB-dependent receptor [Sphingobacteriales bacterium]
MVFYFFNKKNFFSRLLILSSCINCAFAQDSLLKLREVKVSAVKKIIYATPTQQISNANFKQYASFNVADAVRNFAGVNVKDYGGIGGLKTVSVRSLGANHTSVLYDGVAITDSQNGQIDFSKFVLDNVETISLYNAQPTDLPQTAKAYAAASVIVIKTIQPVLDSLRTFKVVAKFTTGSFGLINPVLQWQQKINNKWTYIVNSSLQKAHGRYNYKVDGDGSDTLVVRNNGDIATLQLDASVYGSFNTQNSIFIRANIFQSQRGLPGAVIFYNPITRQRLWENDFYLQTVFKQALGNKINLLFSNKISKNYTKYLDPVYLNQQRELNQQFTQQELYQSVAANYQLNKTVSFNYSVDGFINKLETNLPNFAYPTRLTLLQVFGSALTYKKWNFNANILQTNINERVDKGQNPPQRKKWSPTFMVLYKANNEINLRAFYKNIFRNPTFNDLYYTNFGNRNLNPENVNQYNIGATFNKPLSNKLNYVSLSADAYFNTITDKIIAVPNKDLFVWSIYNLGKVNIYGVDFVSNLNYKINKNWNFVFAGNYTYQLALDVSDAKSITYNNQIPYTPQHTFCNNVGIKNARWGIFYNQIFSSGRYYLSDNSPEFFVKGFFISDLSTSYNFKIGHFPFTSTVEINNLFNTPYSVIRSYPMPSTSTRISLKTSI